VDSDEWYVNTTHSDQDGNITKATPIKTEVSFNGYNPYTIETPLNINGKATPTVSYDESKGYPFMSRIELETVPWLIYNKYDPNANSVSYFVEFFKSAAGWAGKGFDVGIHVDENISTIPNRRINW
jgi:hypothetical protein